MQICDQVSYAHQHGPEEEQTLLIPGGQRDLQNQTAIFVLQGHICNRVRKRDLLCLHLMLRFVKRSLCQAHFISFTQRD